MSIIKYEETTSGDQARLTFMGETVCWACPREDRERLRALVQYVDNIRAALYASARASGDAGDGEWP